jgi:hypothetical protein
MVTDLRNCPIRLLDGCGNCPERANCPAMKETSDARDVMPPEREYDEGFEGQVRP